MKYLLCFCLLLSFYFSYCQPSQDSLKALLTKRDWLPFENKDSITEFYISPKTSSKYVNVKHHVIAKTWIKTIMPSYSNDKGNYTNVGVVNLVEINCDELKFRMIESYVYDSSGNMIEGGKFSPPNNGWKNIIPSSISQHWQEVACRLSDYFRTENNK